MYVRDPLPQRFAERHDRFREKPEYSARQIEINNLEKYASDFVTIYNAAWAQHGEVKEITLEQVMKMFGKMKPIMDPRVIWFAYYKEQPIAMFVNIPDLNQYFKYFKGKMGWSEKLRLLWMKWRGTNKKLIGLVFGVVPKFQSLGIDSYLIYECAIVLRKNNWYDEYEMGWAGEWNPKMVNIYKSLGASQCRRLITYRYWFDPNRPFERHPVMEYK
jgi:GNAT superfamily N-acetyltransferase